MDSYVIKSASYQKNFEKGINMLAEHRLDTSASSEKTDQNISNIKPLNLGIQLEKLDKLYKSGAINKEEFEKAKKKILN